MAKMIKRQPKPATTEQIKAIKKMAEQLNRNYEDFVWHFSKGRTTAISNMYYREAANLINWLNDATNNESKKE
jgi:predicted translin family RNA/ssDNA-binding protein